MCCYICLVYSVCFLLFSLALNTNKQSINRKRFMIHCMADCFRADGIFVFWFIKYHREDWSMTNLQPFNGSYASLLF